MTAKESKKPTFLLIICISVIVHHTLSPFTRIPPTQFPFLHNQNSPEEHIITKTQESISHVLCTKKTLQSSDLLCYMEKEE